MAEALDFFFYGTLRDADVRHVVIGQSADLRLTEGVLPGYRCAPVEAGRFPAVQNDAGYMAPGVLAEGVSLREAARLSYFEGEGYNYGIEECSIDVDGGPRDGVGVSAVVGFEVGSGHLGFGPMGR